MGLVKELYFPSFILFPMMFTCPLLTVVASTGFIESTSKVRVYGDLVNSIVQLFLQICELCFFSLVHYLLISAFKGRTSFLLIYINIFFVGFYIFLDVHVCYNYENLRNNFQPASPSNYKLYALPKKCYFRAPLYSVPNGPMEDLTILLIKYSFSDMTVYYIILISMLVYIFSKSIVLIVKNFKRVVAYAIGREISSNRSINNGTFPLDKALVILTFFGSIYVGILLILITLPSFSIVGAFSFTPVFLNWLVSSTHFERFGGGLKNDEIRDTLRFGLPPGRRWLDDRPNGEFYYVHADNATYCAYNRKNPECKNFNFKRPKHPRIVKKMPNVVFMSIESFSPIFHAVEDDFIHEHVYNPEARYISNKTFYRKSLMPELHEISKQSITFSGVAAHGMPTSVGLYGLITGLYPPVTYHSIGDQPMTHYDDILSSMHNHGYYVSFMQAHDLFFDSLCNVAHRRPAREEAKVILKCNDVDTWVTDSEVHKRIYPLKMRPKLKNCTESEVSELEERLKSQGRDLPKTVDFHEFYIPDPEISDIFNVSKEFLTDFNAYFIPDRVLTRQINFHMKDYFNSRKDDRPLFIFTQNMATHLPYTWFDYYVPAQDIPLGVNISQYSRKDLKRLDRFLKVSKYTDEYFIGEMIKNIREIDSNTILVLTGDHGARDVPVHEKRSWVTDGVEFASDCVSGNTIIDSFFDVSALITYLGDDEVIKKALSLDKLAGKVFKMQADHNDIVYTLFDIINKLNGTVMPPTHRRSRNLIDLALNVSHIYSYSGNEGVSEFLASSDWRSSSRNAIVYEYRTAGNMFRGHMSRFSKAKVAENLTIPTCLVKSTDKDDYFKDAGNNFKATIFKHLTSETYATYHNRVFNYAFRDMNCVERGKCEFPSARTMPVTDEQFYFPIFFFFLSVSFVLGTLLKLIGYIFYILRNEEFKSRDDAKSLIS